jgi:hypothetical protein
MNDKTPEEWMEEVLAKSKHQHELLRQETQAARRVSTKEPFDFEVLCQLYEPIGLEERPTLPLSEAEFLEEGYYLRWDEVRTLQQAAEYIRWMYMNDST